MNLLPPGFRPNLMPSPVRASLPLFARLIVPSILGYALLAALPKACADYTATPVPATTWGTWDAWGTNLCWMGKTFGNRDDVADVLFTTKSTALNGTTLPGLGFTYVRYNAGACGTGSVNGHSMVIVNIPAERQIQGYWVNPNSTDPASSSWNWNVDANQRAMLLKAKARGATKFELFSNAPMWWMLKNYNPAGATASGTDNLSSAHTQNFAIYLATIAKYAQSNWGLNFTTVEPFNEPVSSWWTSTGNQEGCRFANSSQPAIISALRAQLNSRGLSSVGIAASDVNSYDQAVGTWKSFSTTTKSQVSQINVHGYQKASGNRSGLYNISVTDRKKVYNTEYGETDISGMTMASNLNLDLRVLHPTSWSYWQPFTGMDSKDKKWGLVNASTRTGAIGVVEPKYYVMAQYSRHIRPGMTMIDGGSSNTIAAYDPAAKKLVLVTANYKTAQKVTFNLSKFTTVSGPITRWVTVTGSGEKYGKHTDLSLSGKSFSSQLATQSVQTFEIQNVSMGSGSGGPLADGTYRLVNGRSQKALDIVSAPNATGTIVDYAEQRTYTGANDQKWNVTSLGSGQYRVVNVANGRALDIENASTSNGARALTLTPNTSNSQRWTFTALSGGYYSLTAVHSGKVLDVSGGSTADGGIVIQYTGSGGTNQQWAPQAP